MNIIIIIILCICIPVIIAAWLAMGLALLMTFGWATRPIIIGMALGLFLIPIYLYWKIFPNQMPKGLKETRAKNNYRSGQ